MISPNILIFAANQLKLEKCCNDGVRIMTSFPQKWAWASQNIHFLLYKCISIEINISLNLTGVSDFFHFVKGIQTNVWGETYHLFMKSMASILSPFLQLMPGRTGNLDEPLLIGPVTDEVLEHVLTLSWKLSLKRDARRYFTGVPLSELPKDQKFKYI